MKRLELTGKELKTITAAEFAVSATQDFFNLAQDFGRDPVREVLLTLRVTAADRTTGNETYDFYVWSYHKLPCGKFSRWDIYHFPQIAADAEAIHTAILKPDPPEPINVTTAGPGVAAVNTATLATITAGSGQAIRTLGAGYALHGFLGEGLGFSVAGGGTTPGPVTFELVATAK
jgi:hypothetical protein